MLQYSNLNQAKNHLTSNRMPIDKHLILMTLTTEVTPLRFGVVLHRYLEYTERLKYLQSR